jgi:cytochrome c553
MSRMQLAVVAAALVTLGGSLVAQQQAAPAPAAAPTPPPVDLPEWAYTPPNPPGAPPPPSSLPTDDNAIVRIPGVERTLTRGQLRGVKEIPDWRPEEHVGAPDVVRFGRTAEGGAVLVRACGFCHLADGGGRPENASVNGLPVAYFIQQMQDFKNGLRDSADHRKNNTNMMIGFSKLATDAEVKAAAEYFASKPYGKRIKVIESRTAPKVRLQGGMHMPVPAAEGGGMEPIGEQIVEVPDDHLRAEARDTHMGYTAYVPVDSINRGKQLAAAYQCTTCHGANLEGMGPVPPLAGRSPSYTTRQLYDMKLGARKGPWAELMTPIVAKMSLKDMMYVSAYAASLNPPATTTTRAAK